MEQKIFPVRPLGKYGHTYLLNKQTYKLYRICIVGFYIVMNALILLQFIFPKLYKNVFGWPDNFPILLAFLVPVFGIPCLLKFVSHNSTSAREDLSTNAPSLPKVDRKMSIESFSYNFHRIFGLICATIMVALLTIAIAIQLFLEHRVQKEMALALVIFLCIFSVLLNKSRHKK